MSSLQDFFELCGFKVRSYSGRGMYGKYCLAVELDSEIDLGQFVGRLVENATDLEPTEGMQLSDALTGLCTDSLGLGTIVYFPSVEFEGEETQDVQEEEDEELYF